MMRHHNFDPSTMKGKSITDRQIWKIKQLGGDPSGVTDRFQASELIGKLMAAPKPTVADHVAAPAAPAAPATAATAATADPEPESAASSWPLTLPKGMFDLVPDGYFAVQPSLDVQMTFIRIKTQKGGWQDGARKVATQHSDWFKRQFTVARDGRVFVASNADLKLVDDRLLLVGCDPSTAQIRYATELGRCGRCGRELTDNRSRWYGIGPECEKHLPEIIARVDSIKGEYLG